MKRELERGSIVYLSIHGEKDEYEIFIDETHLYVMGYQKNNELIVLADGYEYNEFMNDVAEILELKGKSIELSLNSSYEKDAEC